MQLPSIPDNETERLAALDKYAILDTLPETEYDDITRLATQICGTPVSLITLIEQDRQWFKSRQGMEAIEISRRDSFCAHGINRPKEILIVNDARTDERFHDNPLVTGDSQIVFYAGVPLTTTDGFALGSLCVIDHQPNDLTESQLRSLQALANLVVQLLELRKHKLELQATTETLERRKQDLDNYAYIASHDLQEPLRTIHDFSEILEEEIGDQLAPHHRQFLGYVKNAAVRMRAMILNILKHSRLGENLAISTVSIKSIIDNLLDDLQSMIGRENAHIELIEPLPTVIASESYIRELFQNLITNSIRYRHPDRSPHIRISARELATHWEFRVADNGIGIEEKFQHRVFEMFQRLHAYDKIAGTGIGLTHCRKIVELHEGVISLTSTPGESTTVVFTLAKGLE